jgi:hypothetical protein
MTTQVTEDDAIAGVAAVFNAIEAPDNGRE